MGPLVAKQAITFRMENDHRMGHSPWGAARVKANLFESGWECSKVTPNGGTGLGHALAKRFVEMHGLQLSGHCT